MGVIQVYWKEDFDTLLKSHKIVIIDGSAHWSDRCKAISPFFENYADDIEYDENKVAFIKFEPDEIPDLAEELGIEYGIPAFFIFESGELVDELKEVNPHALNKFMEDAVERSKGD